MRASERLYSSKEKLPGRTNERGAAVPHHAPHAPALQRMPFCPCDGGCPKCNGDGHDLRSPRFKGDPVLEACYDNERLLHYGHRGPAVAKVQQAVTDYFLDLEHRDPLPVYGVDGIFGPETRGAVKEFQASEGLSGKDVDGIVGPITIGILDDKMMGETPGTGLTTEDVFDPRIDLIAQAALMRMSRKDGAQKDAAHGLLDAVKNNTLDGIFGEYRALVQVDPTLSESWSTLPPPWQYAVLVKDPKKPYGSEIAVFRESVSFDGNLLDDALYRDWAMHTRSYPLPPCPGNTSPVEGNMFSMTSFNDSTGSSSIVCLQNQTPSTQLSCSIKGAGKIFDSGVNRKLTITEPKAHPRKGALSDIMFETGTSDQWEIVGAVNMTPYILGDSVDWRHGFIQTVVNMTFLGEYNNSSGSSKTARREAIDCRDAASAQVTAPWTHDPPVKYGPKPILSPAQNQDQALNGDMPRHYLPEKHPKDSSFSLEKIKFKGDFNIWYIALNKSDPVDMNHIVFLSFLNVTLDKWADPSIVNGLKVWVGNNGANKISKPICGKGSKTPKLGTPVAIDELASLKP